MVHPIKKILNIVHSIKKTLNIVHSIKKTLNIVQPNENLRGDQRTSKALGGASCPTVSEEEELEGGGGGVRGWRRRS